MKFEKYIQKNKLEKILASRDWRFDISLLISEARMQAGLTQSQLARKMKTKQPSIARVESGKMLPSLDFLDKLAKAIGTELIAPRFAFIDPENNLTENIEINAQSPSPYFTFASATILTQSSINETKYKNLS